MKNLEFINNVLKQDVNAIRGNIDNLHLEIVKKRKELQDLSNNLVYQGELLEKYTNALTEIEVLIKKELIPSRFQSEPFTFDEVEAGQVQHFKD